MKFTTLFVAATTAAALQVNAVQFDFNTVFTGDTPGGTAPYARLTILQDAPNVLSLELEALGLASNEFISSFNYNISGNAVTTGLAQFDDGTGGVGASTYSFYGGTFTDAGLTFDADVAFPTAGNNGGASRFKDGETFFFKLSRPGLTVDDIDLDMMIHIQGITLSGGRSGSSKVTASPFSGPGTPVPDAGSSLVLLGLGALGIAAARRR